MVPLKEGGKKGGEKSSSAVKVNGSVTILQVIRSCCKIAEVSCQFDVIFVILL